MREREAGKLHDMHQRKKESLTPLEAELDNLRRYLLCLHSDLRDAPQHHQSTPDKTLLLCDIMCLIRS